VEREKEGEGRALGVDLERQRGCGRE
jgi:hypothetical protein